MTTTLEQTTRTVEALYHGEEFAGVRIDGKPYAPFRKGSTRSLVRIGREVMKLGFQSTYEGQLYSRKLFGHPHFWPLTGWGPVLGHRHSRWGWVTQQILPLKRALREYTWDEWAAAYKLVLKVVKEFHLTDVDLWQDDDGSTRAHNWTIYRDTPVIYDFGC